MKDHGAAGLVDSFVAGQGRVSVYGATVRD
jgi:hypothetical protein